MLDCCIINMKRKKPYIRVHILALNLNFDIFHMYRNNNFNQASYRKMIFAQFLISLSVKN